MHLPHPLLLWLVPARALVVVDRIEPPVAVLEWTAGVLTDMPLALLPPGISEGCRLEVVVTPARRGLPAAPSPLLLQTADGPVPLPLPRRRPTRPYALSIRRVD